MPHTNCKMVIIREEGNIIEHFELKPKTYTNIIAFPSIILYNMIITLCHIYYI